MSATFTDTIDAFLGVVRAVRDEQPRDPLRRLEDVLLEMRQQETDR